MTYRCEVCKEPSQHGERANKVVTDTRQHQHPFRKDAFEVRVGSWYESRDDKGGTGTQIVKEVVMCEACLDAWLV